MDRTNKKLLRKSIGCTIVNVQSATVSSGTYLVLDLVEKKQQLKSLSVLLQLPSSVLTKGIHSSNTSPILGLMGLTISHVLVENDMVLFCTDGNYLEANLTTKKCVIVDHKEGFTRACNYETSKQGFH